MKQNSGYYAGAVAMMMAGVCGGVPLSSGPRTPLEGA